MRTVLLAGGTGGAKLAHGLQQVLPAGDLTVVVNVADDLEWQGLPVSPDLDTILYTLAGLADPIQGWGVAGDTQTAMGMLERYGAETWFRVGDADLATHVHRAALMREGASLTDATAALSHALGVPSRLLPATDDPLRTVVETGGRRPGLPGLLRRAPAAGRGDGPALRGRRAGPTERRRARGHRAGGADGDRSVQPARQHRSDPGDRRECARPSRVRRARGSGSAGSWPARRFAGRRTGCSPRWATSRARGEWPRCTAAWSTAS